MRNLDDILKKARAVLGSPEDAPAQTPPPTDAGPAVPSDNPLEMQLPSAEDILPPDVSLEPQPAAEAPPPGPAAPAQPVIEPTVAEPTVSEIAAAPEPAFRPEPQPPTPAPAAEELLPPVFARDVPAAPPPDITPREVKPRILEPQDTTPPDITPEVFAPQESTPPDITRVALRVPGSMPASPDPVSSSSTTPPAEGQHGSRPADGVVPDNTKLDTINLGGQPMSQPQSTTPGQGLGGATPQVPSSHHAAQPLGSTGHSLQQALGKGLDIGTANLVSATQNEGGIQLNLQRNAFIDVQSDVYTKNMLTKLGVPYAVQGNRLYVLGDASFELANIFGRETRRPMQKGLISPSEVDALPVIRLLIERVLGHPTVAGEKLYFSVPAAPIDSDLNVVYHEGIFKGLLSKLGYDATPIVEGHAVTLAELADDNFTGIGISCGGGMFNVCVSYKTIPALAFSTSRAGDWIDQNVAAVCGTPVSKATLVKEEGIDLMNPVGREQEACSIYYRNLINYTLLNIKHRFESSEGMPVFREPVSIVCSGGTSLVGNFIECFREEFQKVSFPIPVKEIRLADNPLMVVAKGALIAAALGD